MVGRHDVGLIRHHDADILHHPLVLMIEDVAMEDKVADVASIACANHDLIAAGLDEYRVLPDAFQVRVLRVASLAGAADVGPRRIEDLHDLERIDVNVEWVPHRGAGQRPLVDSTQGQSVIDTGRKIRLGADDECRAGDDLHLNRYVPFHLVVGDVRMWHERGEPQAIREIVLYLLADRGRHGAGGRGSQLALQKSPQIGADGLTDTDVDAAEVLANL